MLRILRFLRGYVTFKIIGSFPERFINLAAKNGIGVFDAIPQKGLLTAAMLISDYKAVRPVARRSGVRLRIISRHGLPFIINKFRARWGIALGVALFIIISLVMQNFVWSVELNGVRTLSETELLQALDEAGFSEGKFKGALDLHKTQRQILLDFQEIGWMSINLLGTHAEVEIKEKSLVPEKSYSSDYSNVIASSDGIILSENIKRGTSEVLTGSAVSKGQLLVSGMYENALGDIHFVDAEAEIVAGTNYTFTATCDEIQSYLEPSGTSRRAKAKVFWMKFPIKFASEEYPFTSLVFTEQVYLYNTPIPLKIEKEQLTLYRQAEVALSQKEAEARLSADLQLYKLFTLSNCKSIVENVWFKKINSQYLLTAELKCTEDIAVKEKLIVNSE